MDDAKEVVVWGAGEEEGMPWAKEEVERDLISGDLQAIGLKESWYQLASYVKIRRKVWLERCREGVGEVAKYRKKNTCGANRHSQDRSFMCGSTL